MVGFGGDRAVAMRLLEECAAHPSDLQAEAQFALLVTYSRENRHDDVLRVLKGLREQFPRNRLLWIETGATLIRANRPAEALPWLNDGWAMLARDTRPRAFGEEATWRYKRGLAFAMLGRGAEARAEADAGAALQASRWVKGRLAAVSGRVEDLAGNRAAALQAYRRAVELCKAGNDPLGVEDAERWIDKPFRGTSVAPGRQYQ
jgi:tetratricopeptide (TPR) repeat protein